MKTTAAAKILTETRNACETYPTMKVAMWTSARTKIEKLMRKATEQSPELETAWKICADELAALPGSVEYVAALRAS